MEMMPQPHAETLTMDTRPLDRTPLPMFGPVLTRDWRAELPTLVTPQCTLRELTLEDAPSLYGHLTTKEVARYISPPPTSVGGFETFIGWAHRERASFPRPNYAIFRP